MSWHSLGDAPSKEWAKRLREREQRGDHLTIFQREAWREALKVQEKHEATARPS